jgi:hypothetical protein
MRSNILYNPFNQIAGFLSLIIGLFGLLIVTWLAFITGTHFNGLVNVTFAKDSEYWVFLTENISNWFFISSFMYISGLILSKSKIRAIDVWGTTLLSRIPLIITPMIRIIPVFQSFVIQSWQRYFVNGVYLASLVWFLILLFHAFKISCNLKNERLIASFITSMVLAEICTTIFIKLII